MSKIRFLFEPDRYEAGTHAITRKDAIGRSRRYLTGVSSGIQVDAHGERMTENAIRSFMQQANDGHILLFADTHGVSATDDIGILTLAKVLENGDWYTEYRLYDSHDMKVARDEDGEEIPGIDRASVDRANKLWMQVNGLGPYAGKPLEKGFSIEGTVEDENIVFDSAGRRALDNVELDGVVVVPRPAYKPSVVNAVSKALGIAPPPSLRNRIQELMRRQTDEETLFRKQFQIQDALERVIAQVVSETQDNPNEMRDQLDVAFDEYKGLMVDLIVGNAGAIIGNTSREAVAMDKGVEMLNVSKAIKTSLDNLLAAIQPRRST